MDDVAPIGKVRKGRHWNSIIADERMAGERNFGIKTVEAFENISIKVDYYRIYSQGHPVLLSHPINVFVKVRVDLDVECNLSTALNQGRTIGEGDEGF